jgi:hypothetical protein
VTEDEQDQAVDREDEANRILSLYAIVFTKFNQEGDGIWGRFNIVLALNLAVFAGVALICFADRRPIHWKILAIALSLGGLLISLWSLWLLNRLWDSHWHWRECLEKIQERFPASWVKPVGPRRSRWPGLTQPFPYAVRSRLDIACGCLIVLPRGRRHGTQQTG